MVERVVVGPWKTNCYIYSSTKKECIVIDPGGDEEEIASRVDVLNMVPIGIALTHGHVDHLAALGRLQASYASRGYTLPIAISPADRRFLGSGAVEAHKESLKVHSLDEMDFFTGDTPDLPKADVKLKEGDRVFDMDLVVIETPGHTPGSLCFYSEKEGVLFSGDTLFFDGVGRSDLPGGSEKKLRESIREKNRRASPRDPGVPGARSVHHGRERTARQPILPPAPSRAKTVGAAEARQAPRGEAAEKAGVSQGKARAPPQGAAGRGACPAKNRRVPQREAEGGSPEDRERAGSLGQASSGEGRRKEGSDGFCSPGSGREVLRSACCRKEEGPLARSPPAGPPPAATVRSTAPLPRARQPLAALSRAGLGSVRK